MASAGGIRMGKVFVEIGADASKFFAAVEGINRQVGKIGASMSKVGSQIMTAGAAMAAPFALASRASAQFQDALLNVSASTGATSQQLQQVRAAAMQMSEALGVGPTEAAQGFLELLKAGMPLEQVLGGAGEAAIQFAKVGQMAVADASVVMADAMKVFGVDAGTAANTISAAADASSTSIQLLAQSFSQAGAVAGLANQSIQSTATALALLANAGIKGSDAGTSLKTMLMKLMSPSNDAAEALASVGLSTQSFRDADGKMKPLADMIGVLSKALEGMDRAAKDDIFRRVFGSDAIRAAAVLTDVGAKGFADMQSSMGDALSVGEKYKQLMSGLSGSFSAAFASAMRLAITIGDALAPSLTSFFQYASKAIEAVRNFAADNKGLVASLAQGVVTFMAAGAAIWTIGKGLSLLSSIVGVALGGISAFGTVFGVAAAAVGLVLSPLGLVAIAIGTIVANSNEAQQAISSAFSGVSAMLAPIGESLAETFGPVLQGGIDLMGQLAATASTTFAGIGEAISAGDLSMAMDVLWAGLYAGWMRGSATLMNAVDPWIEALQNVFADLGTSIYLAWDNIWTTLATNDFGAIILGLFDNIVNGVMATVDWLVGNIQKAWTRINGFISGATDTQEKLDEIDAKNKANADERGRTRPGIEGRRRAAREDADKIRQESRDRQAAVTADAQAAKDARAARTASAAEARNAAAAEAEANVAGKAAGAREANTDKGVAEALIQSLSSAKDMDELTNIGQSISALIERDAISSDMISKVQSAYNAAAQRIFAATATAGDTPSPGAGGSSGGTSDPAGIQAAATAAAKLSAETAGTFSSVGLGGMGYGSSLAEKQLEELRRIAKNTEEIGDEGAVAA